MTEMIVHGITVPLSPNDVSPEIWQALSNETYEAKEARLIFKCVRPHDRVLELGTGIGILASLIASVEGVHVWTFEASPSSVELAHRVIDANEMDNITLAQGILSAGPPRALQFFDRPDLWMSSLYAQQGSYSRKRTITSRNIDDFVHTHAINVLVMDIEGAEHDLLVNARLPGIERIFLELHDHLYGLDGVRDITEAMAAKGFAYDPRGSSGPCVLFSRDRNPRTYEPEYDHD